MCQKNVGRLDAYCRIGAGLVLISVGIMRNRGCLATLGSMKVASGVTRYCPVLDMLDCSTVSDEEIIEEVLGAEFEADMQHQHECDYEDDLNEGRRQYIHRGIKRNQYQNRY